MQSSTKLSRISLSAETLRVQTTIGRYGNLPYCHAFRIALIHICFGFRSIRFLHAYFPPLVNS